MRKQPAIVSGIILRMAVAASLVIAANAQLNESVNSSPPDLTNYVRPALPQDLAPGGKPAIRSAPLAPVFPDVLVVDTVVNNTDPTLTNTDTFGDSEPSIAVSPDNPDNIVITAFSGFWSSPGSFAPLWQSTDGGNTWTKQFTIPIPPGAPGTSGCPCDQEVDYGRGGGLSGTFLSVSPTNVYSGTTTDPSNGGAFMWFVTGGVTQRTNSAGVNNADQPQLLVDVDPFVDQDDIYAAYDNFSGSPDMRVAGSPGTSPASPPDFSGIDKLTGFSTGFVNPGHRLAVDPQSGAVYSLFQRVNHLNGDGSKNIDFTLNRSTDGGQTWGLNGSATGITAANGGSVQPTPKFGTVNALLGGVDHVTVDPATGDVYVVYGDRDSTGNQRLSIVRLTDDGTGGLTIGPSNFVTDQVQAALPSVAVTNDPAHTVGVLYDTFDGFDPTSAFPIFSAHLAISQDQGVTFTDQVLETFLSPARDNGNSRQRVLGDYQQLKAVGGTFFGVFTGNGVPFGRPFSNTDAIFFRTDAPAVCGGNAAPTASRGRLGN